MKFEVIIGEGRKLTFIRCSEVGAHSIMLNFINSDANDVPLPGTDWGPAGGSEAPERREAKCRVPLLSADVHQRVLGLTKSYV